MPRLVGSTKATLTVRAVVGGQLRGVAALGERAVRAVARQRDPDRVGRGRQRGHRRDQSAGALDEALGRAAVRVGRVQDQRRPVGDDDRLDAAEHPAVCTARSPTKAVTPSQAERGLPAEPMLPGQSCRWPHRPQSRGDGPSHRRVPRRHAATGALGARPRRRRAGAAGPPRPGEQRALVGPGRRPARARAPGDRGRPARARPERPARHRL